MEPGAQQQSWLKGQRIKLLLVMLFALPLAALDFYDFAVHYPRDGWELKSGRVIMRALAPTFLGIKRPLLTVRIDGTDTAVFASLASNAIDDLPAHVTFYYSGDPSKEVLLQEETNPFWVGLFFLVAPFAGLWLINRFMSKPGGAVLSEKAS